MRDLEYSIDGNIHFPSPVNPCSIYNHFRLVTKSSTELKKSSAAPDFQQRHSMHSDHQIAS